MNLFVPDNLPDDFFDDHSPETSSDVEKKLNELTNKVDGLAVAEQEVEKKLNTIKKEVEEVKERTVAVKA